MKGLRGVNIADRIVMADRGTDIAPNLWVKVRHQRLRSAKTPSRNSSMEIVSTSPDFIWRSLSAASSSETSYSGSGSECRRKLANEALRSTDKAAACSLNSARLTMPER